jgi:hypothetical protein
MPDQLFLVTESPDGPVVGHLPASEIYRRLAAGELSTSFWCRSATAVDGKSPWRSIADELGVARRARPKSRHLTAQRVAVVLATMLIAWTAAPNYLTPADADRLTPGMTLGEAERALGRRADGDVPRQTHTGPIIINGGHGGWDPVPGFYYWNLGDTRIEAFKSEPDGRIVRVVVVHLRDDDLLHRLTCRLGLFLPNRH